ncbi:Soluble aldose sugar dehydrogenase YliI precursor [Planctomycetes bacterium Poly30]|uniref:Soluble aldose sugar dehydrogenase YliI n=1 Tax=Saltatorellus ferox TaxID=2528018 RepID=A0A518EXE5_9BACT|nr:Soluble aldose sugar dehydrogenase YliI precursor [Planctomycetes bacterium Poly30]
MFASQLLLVALAPLAQTSTPSLQLIADTTNGLVDPISMASIPGDDRLFLVEREGQVRVLRNGVIEPALFLDFPAPLALTVSTGLRAVAFHPSYASNGFVYCWYDAPSTSGAIVDAVLGRMTRSASQPGSLDPASLVEILRAPQANYGHACGSLEFGRDGYLYVLLGDGGNPGDPGCNSQDPSTLMGSLMRIDVDSAFPYAVPADNPFVGDPAIRDEIWHRGFRHPWKWSFDRVTGDLWIADVGQATREEIDFVPAGVGGLNFGWKVMEGTACFNASGCAAGVAPCGDASYTPPLYEYDHSLGCSITGGFVYRGSDLPHLRGHYVYADFCSGRVWSFRRGPGGQIEAFTERTAQFQPASGGHLSAPVAFGEDGFGELYLIDYADKELYRLGRDEDVTSYCVAAPNAAGQAGARATATGSTSLAANDLSFRVDGLPPASFGLYFYGSEVTNVRSGNGYLCVGGGLFRLPVAQSNASGVLTLNVDSSVPPMAAGAGEVSVGTTWAFQCWYRDVGGPLGQPYNFSDALSVQFRP